MNEVVKASIAGIGFSFDPEAFRTLAAYLDRLAESYTGNPDGAEIVADIEARIVELILSKQTPEQVVSLPVIETIVGQLGMPEDIGKEAATPTPNAATPAEGQFPRRLYRNPDGAKLGGVCNGLATFFHTDPVWIRLAMFVPLFLLIILPPIAGHRLDTFYGFLGSLFGMVVLLYFIMWIVVPVAKKPRQKLEMTGRPITARTIEREVAQEATAMPPATHKSASVMAQIFVFFGRLLMFFVKLVVALMAFGMAIGVIFSAIWIVYITTSSAPLGNVTILGIELTKVMQGMEGMSLNAYIILVLLVALLPMVMLVYQMIRFLFNARNSRTFMWILGGMWILSVLYTGIIALRNRDVIRENTKPARYEKYEFMTKGFGRDGKGTVVINGDTLVSGRSKRHVENFLERLYEIDTLGRFTIEETAGDGDMFTISITQQKDSLETAPTVNPATNQNTETDGDNRQ